MNVVAVEVEAPLGTLPRRVLLVVVLVCAAVLERIEVALSMAHDPGASSGTFGDIATPVRLTTEKVATGIAQAWGQFKGVGAAKGLIPVYGAVDVLLMFSLAILLVVMSRVLAGEAVSSFRGWLVRNAAVVGYLVADLVETLAVVFLWRALLTESHAMLIAGASLLKWLFLVVAVGALLVRFAQSGGQMHLARALLALRGQVVVVVVLLGLLLALSGPLGRQIDEVMVIAAEGGTAAALALVFGVGASAALAWGGSRCAVAYQHPASRPDDVTQRRWGRIGLVLLVIAGVTFAVSGATPDRWDASRHATAVAFCLVGALLTPSCIAWVRGENVETVGDADDGVEPAAATGGSLGTPPPRWLVRVVADIPLLALLIAIVRAATTAWTAGQSSVVQDLVVFGVGTAVVWLALHLLLDAIFFSGMETALNAQGEQPQQQGAAGSRLRAHLIEAALAVVLLVILGGLPLGFFTFLGTPAIVMLFALTAALLTTALTLVGDDVRWGGVLDAVGVLRVPVFTLVLVWGIVASVVDTRGAYYDVRTEVSAPARESILGAFKRWRFNQDIDKPQRSRTVVPLVFVAAHGGGIRAAYWTRIGMECTFGTLCDEGVPRTVFLASGVSGGALGLASFRAGASSPAPGPQEPLAADTALGHDFIAPTLAAFLFRDLPNSLLRLPLHDLNRAATLEQAWEKADPQLENSFGQDDSFPRLVLNSTSVEDGCRLVVTDVQIDLGGNRQACEGALVGFPSEGPGDFPVRDAFDHLCEGGQERGLRVSTAVMMAARFSYVSPSGVLEGCGDTGRTFALDGGLVDNSGATAVEQTWAAIAPTVEAFNQERSDVCVTPRLVIFDNEQVVAGTPGSAPRPLQATAPLESILGGFGRRSATPLARAVETITAAATTGDASCGGTVQNPVAVITPQEQPGPGLPLGWTLSEQSRQQMRCLLAGDHITGTPKGQCADTQHNWDSIKRVWSWFPKA